MNFMIFDEFVKSEVSLRNRDLESFLRSKFIEKYLFGKLRVSTFHRLKNQRLRTSPSKVTKNSKFYKIHNIQIIFIIFHKEAQLHPDLISRFSKTRVKKNVKNKKRQSILTFLTAKILRTFLYVLSIFGLLGSKI